MGNLSAILSGVTRLRSGTTSIPIVRPALGSAAATVVPGSPAGTMGAWVEIVAANTLGAHLVTGFTYDMNSIGTDADSHWNFQFGTGSAGSEVNIGEFKARINNRSNAGIVWVPPYNFAFPLQLPSNVRLACRGSNSDSTAVNAGITASLYPSPF